MRKSAAVSLVAIVILSLAAFLNAQTLTPSPTGSWTLTGAMSQARSGAAAAALASGSVLVTGGTDQNGVISASAELYTASGTFTPVAPMNVPRTGHTATWLQNDASGTAEFVLVTGGTTTNGAILASAELYDPVANTWTLLPSPMIDARTAHAATAIPNYSVLLSGGLNSSGPLASVEQFNLASQQFTFVEAMLTARTNHAAAALQNGQVLIVGGTDANGNTLNTTAIYDPVAGTVTAGPNLNTPRANATATTLLDGTILIAGGSYPEGAAANGNIAELNTAEIYNPTANTITLTTANLAQARAGQLAFLLPNNNNVLLVGGTYNGATLASTELYTPWLATFAAAKPLSTPRSSATGGALVPTADGQLLVAGGSNSQPSGQPGVANTVTVANTAELYGFATVETDKTDYLPGDPLVISGSGWNPGETVAVTIHQTTGVVPDQQLALTASLSGAISNASITIQPADSQLAFLVTAVGAASQAQTEFWDASISSLTIGTSPLYVLAGGTAGFSVTVNSNDDFTTESGNVTLNSVSPAQSTITASAVGFNFFTTFGGSQTVTLNVATTSSTPVGSYTLTIGNTETTSKTVNATLVVGTVPTVTTQPTNQTTTYGSSATFTAAGGGSPAPTVQWQQSTNSGSTWSNISGATSTTYTLTNVPLADNNYEYRAVFTNSLGSVNSNAATLTVNKATLTVTGITASNKTYDGTTTATINTSGATLVGKLNGDTVNLSTSGATGAFSDKNVATGKTVQISGLTISGSGSGNYTLTQPTATANITARAITVTAAASSKGYDGGTTSTAVPTITSGSLATGDTATWTESYDNKNVGTTHVMTPAGTVSDGNSGNNYTVTKATISTGVITARAITVTAAASTKTYDGGTTSTAVPTITSGSLASGDTVTWTESYDNKNVGTTHVMTPAGTVSDGNSGNNYAVTKATISTGVISALPITVTAAASSKGYDGGTTSTAVPTITSGSLASGDSATWTESYDNKNVGTTHVMTPAGSVSDGNGGNNYTVTKATISTGVITARAITVTAAASSKGYDGGTTSTAVPTITVGSLVSGDTATWTESYDNKNVGTTHVMTPAGTVSDGNGGNNYAVTFATINTGVITARAITVTAAASTKTYDGGTTSTAVPTITSGSLASGDTVTWTESYDNKNVGTTHVMTPAGTVSDGNSGNNYAVTKATISTGVISALPITVTAAASSKGYDGGTTSTAVPTITSGSLASGDTATWTESYDNKNVGTTHVMTPAGSVSDGNGGNNYTVTKATISTGVITARAITVTAAANSKPYDGTPTAAAVPTITVGSLVSGDTATWTESYDNKNVGTTHVMTPAGSVSDGNSGNNYAVTFATSTSGVITARAITVTAAANSKPYDGTITAAAVPTITVGSLATGDTSNFTETYGSKNVGTGLTLTPTGTVTDGNSGNNYAVTFATSTSGVITARAITVTAAANSKPYDGTITAAAVPTITVGSLATGDTSNFTETYGSKNVGTGLTLTPTGTVTDGNSGNNYAVTFATSTSGVITARAITVTAAANSKPYDGTPTAAAVPTITVGSLATGDTSNFTESYASKNVGTGLTLTPTGTVTDGNSGNNYAVTFATSTSGVITAIPASVTSNTATKVYGASDPVFSGTLSGFLPADAVTASYSRTAGETVAGGPYTISATLSPSGVLSNYNITYNTAQFTITKATASVTPNASSKAYGATDPSFSGSLTGFLAGDNVTASYSRTAGETVAGGPYTISATLSPSGVLSNYNITYNTAQFTITQATASVTPNASSKAYGATDPSFSGTLTGFLAGDNVTASYSRIAGETVAGGPYTISATLSPSGVLSNYNITYNTAQFTITKATASVTPNASSKAYGATDPSFSGTLTGFLAGDNVTASYSRTAGETVAGGPYTISATLSPSGVLSNYNITYNTAQFTITQAPATVVLGNLAQTYSGSPEPVSVSTLPTGVAVTLSYTGSGSTSYSSTTTPPTNPGTYQVVASVIDSNYSGGDTETLTINQLSPALSLGLTTGESATAPYGTTVYFALSMASTPLCPTGSVQLYVDSVASGSPVLLSGASCTQPVQFQTATMTAGPHSISAVYSGDTYYQGGPSATLPYTVTPDATSVTLSATGTSANVGSPLTFTATVTPAVPAGSAPVGTVQFYDGTTPLGTGSTLTTTSPYTSTFTTSTLPAGPHSISATFVDSDGQFAGNSSSIATETVNLIVPTINWTPAPTEFAYGTALGAPQLNAAAVDPITNNSVNGTFGYNFATGTVLPVGTPNLIATFTPADPTTYAGNSATVTLTVDPAALTVTADSLSRDYGTDNPTLTYQIAGFVNNDPSTVVSGAASCSTTATATSPVAAGGYPISCSLGTLAAANYTFQFASGTLTVNQATATVVLSDLSPTYTGSSLTPTATTTPAGLAITWTNAPQTSAGTYSVTATVNDPNYTGSASGSFVIGKATATVALSNLTPTYTGSALTPTAATTPSGLSVTLTGAPQTNAGTYPVTATVNDPNYTGSASGSFVIGKATATVALSNLTPTYTGSALTPTAATTPSGLSVTLTGAPQTSAGTYPVTATVNDPNYTGSASGSFVIGKAAPTVGIWPSAGSIVFGQTLASASLTGGSGTPSGGTFAFATPTATPGAGTPSESVIYTPSDTTDYSTATGSITVAVSKATPVIAWVAPATIIQGTALSATQLDATSGGVGGSLVYTPASGTVLASGLQTLKVTFNPSDANDYNSASASVTLTVESQGVDLIESAVSGPVSAASGGTIQVIDTATNVGNQTAAMSATGFYLSTDGVTKGSYLGYRNVAALTALASSGPVTTTLTVPTGLNGTYYVLACANYPGTVVEVNTANNCTATASFPVAGADLIESAVSVLTGSPVSGGSLQVSDTTMNQGGGIASLTATGFYLSIDGTTKGTYLAYRNVATLASGASNGPVTTTFTLPTNLNGTYYVIACANYSGSLVESNTANNCKASAPINVAPADLLETAVSVVTSAPVSGGSIQVSDTVQNQGAGNAGMSYTGFYLSTDGVTKGTYLAYRNAGSLVANAVNGPVTTTFTLPTGLNGNYFLIACADYSNQVAEANKANNCKASTQFTVVGPDLIESAASILTTSPVLGGSMQVSDTVLNQGPGVAPLSATGFYLSTNGTTKGTYLGYRNVGTLASAGTSGPVTTTFTLPASTPAGTYHVIACANYNNSIVESNTANDCTASSNTMLVP